MPLQYPLPPLNPRNTPELLVAEESPILLLADILASRQTRMQSTINFTE